MKIGIDVRMVQDFPTGIGNYLENLVKALANISGQGLDVRNRSFSFILIGNRGNKMESWALDQPRFEFVVVKSKPNSIHQHFLLPFEIRNLSLDVFWTTPWGASVFLPIFRQKYALTIYDLLYRRYPELASFKARVYEALVSGWVARMAGIIFTISDFVKKDIVDFLGVKKGKVFNVQGAAAEAYKPIADKDMMSRVLHQHEVTRPFFVYLGNFRPHKNLATLLRAFANVKTQMSQPKAGWPLAKKLKSTTQISNLKLVLVGSVDAEGRDRDLENLLNLLRKFKLQDAVILTGRIADDREVAAVLNEAVALVHPSFHEGFGLTVLEAMSCGTPVIAANTTSIPEVVGDSGMLVDPLSVEELVEAMKSIYLNYTTNWEKYQRARRRSIEQAKKFSWEKVARKVLDKFEILNPKYETNSNDQNSNVQNVLVI